MRRTRFLPCRRGPPNGMSPNCNDMPAITKWFLETRPRNSMRLPPRSWKTPKPLPGDRIWCPFIPRPSTGYGIRPPLCFFSFAVFFAMIFADAGYSALMGLVIAGLWKKMGRSENGPQAPNALPVAWWEPALCTGVIVGSYFRCLPRAGIAFRPGSRSST